MKLIRRCDLAERELTERGGAGYPNVGRRSTLVALYRDRWSEDGLSSRFPASWRIPQALPPVLAIRALNAAAPLRPGALLFEGREGPSLGEDELRRLGEFGDHLARDPALLAASNRPDWGGPLLLGMARLEAIERSLELRRLVVLDAFPAEVRPQSPREVVRRRPFLEELEERTRIEVDAAWTRLLRAEEILEPDYAWLESAANRHLEIARGLAEGRGIRLYSGRLQPRGVATGSNLPRPVLSTRLLRRADAAARSRESAHTDRLRQAFGYDLLDRNCATEIFTTLAAEFGRDEADQRLGGYVDPGSSLNFVPALAFESVLRQYRIVEVGEVPPYRRTRIEALVAEASGLTVVLREASTLTSTIYRWNPHDSFFVFFTEDVPLLRPLLGALNLTAAAGELALGLLRAPLDRGDMAWSGMKGVVSSLPELLFMNLRKGHMEYAPGASPRTSYRRVGRVTGVTQWPRGAPIKRV